MTKQYLIGIDVGTGSARAGVFDAEGNMMASAAQDIKIWKPKPDFVEQSSEDIWQSVAVAVKEAVAQAGIKREQVKGIGFDATCSLVVLDEKGAPLSVSPEGPAEQNVMVWMDHRAKAEADLINNQGHEVLRYVGNTISPEMETPKLLWLKKNHPKTWNKAARFLDLADFLVFQATGSDVRSACTTVCKWTYLGHEESASTQSIGRWDASYFKSIGLEDLVEDDFSKIGKVIRPVGEAAGNGLTQESANALGLQAGTPVGIGMIDAHAGGLGLLGMKREGDKAVDLETRVALIGGTSSCHMAVSKEPIFIDGVWGPYSEAMIPGFWLNEGGQSATGALIDHVIFSSQHAQKLGDLAKRGQTTVYSLLNNRLQKMTEYQGLGNMGELTKGLHILPYFHGNRSPRANPSLTGSMVGLKLSDTMDDLAVQYLATIQAIAYGTRHIIESMNESGYAITEIVATGGGTKNDVFLQQHADICGCEIILPKETEAVLLGSAVLGAVASGVFPSVVEAMENMNQVGETIIPKDDTVTNYHDAKYNVFKKMYEDQVSYNTMMEQVNQ